MVADRRQAAAFVVAEGSIVLSQKALDIINHQADAALADARLAFVLGHELAHLAGTDFWDHQAGPALLASGAGRGDKRGRRPAAKGAQSR